MKKKLMMIVVVIVLAVIAVIAGWFIYDDNRCTEKAKEIDALIETVGYQEETSEEAVTEHNITLESEEAITSARTTYEDARKKVQNKVTKYGVLKKAEKQLDALKDAISTLEDTIEAIGYDETLGNDVENFTINGVSLESEEKIVEARSTFDAASAYLQEKISNSKKLTESEEILAKLKTIQEVVSKIDSLGDVTLESEDALTEARTAYDALSDDEKEYVPNYDTLTNDESKLQELKDEKEKEEAEAAAKAKKEAEEKAAASAASSSSNSSNESSSSNSTTTDTTASSNTSESTSSTSPYTDPSYCTYINNDSSYDVSALNQFIRSDLKILCENAPLGYFSYSTVNGIYGYKSYCFALSCQDDVNAAVAVLQQAGY